MRLAESYLFYALIERLMRGLNNTLQSYHISLIVEKIKILKIQFLILP